MNKLIASIFFAVVMVSVCLADGIEAEFEVKNLEKTEPPLIQKFYISGDRISMQAASGESKGTVIYRGDKQLMWIMDNQNRQYTEMTKETMEQMGQTVNSAMDQMKAQMANMPPEQRAMMEKLMKGQMDQIQGASQGASGSASAQTVPLIFKKTGVEKTVNGYACEKYDVFRGREKLREMWVTEWKNMKDFNEAMTAFNSMEKFFSGMMERLKNTPFAKSMDIPYSHTAELNGFPVMITELKNGVPVMEATLKSATKKSLPDSYFSPPADYKANKSLFPSGAGNKTK
jgi:hypothetical protein